MSGLELEPVDGGTSIPLPEGETQLGRGPFLGVSDKRVSRQHGLLEVSNGELRIKPTHQNPCFYQPSLEDPPEPLEKDRWHVLHPGNLFSLLPGKYIFRVVSISTDGTQRNSQIIEEKEEDPATDVPPASAKPDEEALLSPELNGRSEPTLTNTPNQQAEPTYSCLWEKEEGNKTEGANKEQEPESREPAPKPEQKKRILPAWMMQIAPVTTSPSTSTGARKRGRGKATPTEATQARPRKGRPRSVSSEESEPSEVEKNPRKRAKRLMSEEEEEADVQSKDTSEAETRQPRGPSTEELGEASDYGGRGSDTDIGEGRRNGGHTPKVRPPERKRGGDVNDGGEMESQSQGRERVEGGQEVGSTEVEASAGKAGPSQSKAKAPPRASCPYGKNCYRKNPVHFKECSHPGDSDYKEEEDEEGREEDDDRPECPYGTACYRKNPQHKKEYKHTQDPGKKAGSDDEDEGEEDEWDDDSFINDDSGDLDLDSDYVPPESEEEDVKRLKKEAKAFLKKKR